MKFWKSLAWLCTVGFLLLLVTSWLGNDHHSATALELQKEPPPAPTFR